MCALGSVRHECPGPLPWSTRVASVCVISCTHYGIMHVLQGPPSLIPPTQHRSAPTIKVEGWELGGRTHRYHPGCAAAMAPARSCVLRSLTAPLRWKGPPCGPKHGCNSRARECGEMWMWEWGGRGAQGAGRQGGSTPNPGQAFEQLAMLC